MLPSLLPRTVLRGPRFISLPSMFRLAASLVVLCASVGTACSTKTASVSSGSIGDAATPRGGDASAPAGTAAPFGSPALLGASCTDDAQCDDGHACTLDECLDSRRCSHQPDDSVCSDGVFCNGVEVCDPRTGCGPGPLVSCTDGIPCTIDVCDESTRSCTHQQRDVDEDGEADALCDGTDCDDLDPRVSSSTAEVCANGRDDDCDGENDETDDCAAPEFDRCGAPLVVATNTFLGVDPRAASLDEVAPCLDDSGTWRDLVVAVDFDDEGKPYADVTVATAEGKLALAVSSECDDVGSSACGSSALVGGRLAVARALVAGEPGQRRWIHVYSTSDAPIELSVEFVDAVQPVGNTTCSDASTLAVDEHVDVATAFASSVVETRCVHTTGHLFYRFDLEETSDVRLFAVPTDRNGLASVSLRRECDEELVCSTGANARAFARALPPGTYRVAVAALGPADLDVLLEVSEPTQAPPGDGCEDATLLDPSREHTLTFDELANDIVAGCVPGAIDAAVETSLDDRSDVLWVARSSPGSLVALTLAQEQCTATAEGAPGCAATSVSPARLAAHGLAAGTHRVVVENADGAPVGVTVFERAAAPAILVALADTCDRALDVPDAGGFFQGNTNNSAGRYELSCDVEGEHNAPEQLLRLSLDEPRRVVLDMQGSAYPTLLAIRKSDGGCVGPEVAGACAAGFDPQRSYLDVDLDAGDYFVQVDGLSGEAGRWFLDVFLADPR